MSDVTPAYRLEGLQLLFARHSSSKHSDAHKKLQQIYGGIIDDIDDLWTDDSRTTLVNNVSELIRRKITIEVSEEARHTVDKAKIAPFFQDVILGCTRHDDPNIVTSIRKFGQAIKHAKRHKRPLITIQISFNSWHFKPNFSPTNFDDIQLNEPFADEPPVGLPTPAVAGTGTTPQAIATAFITAMGLTPTTVTPGNTTTATDANTTPTGGNLDQDIGQLFSPNKLPADVKERFLKAKSSNVMLTKWGWLSSS